jgi:hypothetical protein
MIIKPMGTDSIRISAHEDGPVFDIQLQGPLTLHIYTPYGMIETSRADNNEIQIIYKLRKEVK